jgi:membrane fusion protein, copper/silver efflux system
MPMKMVIAAGASMAVLAGAIAGYRIGAGTWPSLQPKSPQPPSTEGSTARLPTRDRGILYWKHPDGGADYSQSPKKTVEGRDYVPVYEDQEADFQNDKSARTKGEGKILYYRNPMGLPDTSPVPKKDWMGMDYIPVYEGEENSGNTVKISPGRLQRTGVRTEVVRKIPLAQIIRAPSVVAFDERRLSVVAMRFDGYINKVMPVTSGTHVHKGQPLMSVFGQELLNAGVQVIIEEVTGWKGPERGEASAPPSARDPRSRVVGARRRLENLQVPAEAIEEIKSSRRVPDGITWLAPQDGIITERNAVDGQAFKAGDVLFRLADHSSLWVLADVAEGEIGAVRPGQAVTMRAKAHPGRMFNGKVGVVYPHLMKETRTARVRIEMPNPDLVLLPDMYGEVEIATGSDQPVVVVPTNSVIDSGTRQVVIADLGDGRFESRDVKLGRRGSGYVEVLDGVQAGDSVVVDGNFLIDAESNLRAALKALAAPPKEPQQ